MHIAQKSHKPPAKEPEKYSEENKPDIYHRVWPILNPAMASQIKRAGLLSPQEYSQSKKKYI